MRTPKTRAALLAGLLLAASALSGVNPPTASAAADPVTVTVNTRAGLATVPDTALGVNHAIWDTNLGTTQTSDLLRDAGVQMMRYPGGSYADIYHWKDHTAPGGYVAPGTDFDTFMAAVRRAGAQPMIIANYGTGTPPKPPTGCGTPTSPRATTRGTGRSATRTTATATTAPRGRRTTTRTRARHSTRGWSSSTRTR
ncbi:hypothetical protein NKG94_05800 [Micromonospora sp. M12]